ncbi:MAG: sugar ABC transporter permease [Eubacteriales bacterium]|nr:sugar ABC transporter permease [Eubacteriales bacterium]
MNKKAEQRFAYGVISPALIIVFGVIIVPMFTTLYYTVVNTNLSSAHYGDFAGLQFYASVLGSATFWADLWRTLYFSIFSTLLETVIGLAVALLLNGTFPGVKFLRGIIIIPWAIPTVVNASLWKLIFNGQYGVFNAILQHFHLIGDYVSWLGNPATAMNMIIIADTWKMTPLAVIFFLAALQSLNYSTHEAAMVDGANVFKRFWVITLPHLKPTIFIVVVMRMVEKFKAFDIFYIMTRGGPANSTKTLMYDAYLSAFNNLNYSVAATYAFLIAIIVVGMVATSKKLMMNGGDELV